MKSPISHIAQTYFGPTLDLRVRLFNVLVMISACFCAVIAIVNAFAGIGPIGVLVDLVAVAFCLSLLICARLSGRAHICHLISIVGSFFVLFPYLFFHMGGYHGGIPAFLVFAVVFTVFMLEGKTALLVTTLELMLYAVMYLYAYLNPASVTIFPEEKGFLISNLMDLLVVGVALGATMYAQVRLYRVQQRKLDEQNAILAQMNRAKTEFLANASHEMRTPLTVVSVNVQTVMGILRHMDEAVKDPEVAELLADAQKEIMRLARMVGGVIRLSTAREDARITVAVSDNGSGIAPELLPHVFERGVTGKVSGSKAARESGLSQSGTGFGLYLCKTVVESHGGEIWIESESGQGTTVTFTLPVYELMG